MTDKLSYDAGVKVARIKTILEATNFKGDEKLNLIHKICFPPLTKTVWIVWYKLGATAIFTIDPTSIAAPAFPPAPVGNAIIGIKKIVLIEGEGLTENK